jgi:hypothetical protein
MERFGIATLNLHAKACRKTPLKVYADLVAALEAFHVVGVQEAGIPEAKVILQRLVASGLAYVYAGPGSGSAGTALLVRVGVDIRDEESYQLTPNNLKIGPGAGPSTIPAKYLNTVRIFVSGRPITVGNLHGIASAYLPHRRKKALSLFQNASNAVTGIGGSVVVVADLNRPPGHATLKPLANAGLVSTQIELGHVRTHLAGAIDDVMYRQPKGAKREVLRPAERVVVKTTSDHDLYGIIFEVIPAVAPPPRCPTCGQILPDLPGVE